MTDTEKFVKTHLKFCPVCGSPLEQHPNKEMQISCYWHGDFVLRWDDKTLVTEWKMLSRPERLVY